MLEDFSTAIADEALGILANKSDLFQQDNRDVIENGELKHLKLFVNGNQLIFIRVLIRSISDPSAQNQTKVGKFDSISRC